MPEQSQGILADLELVLVAVIWGVNFSVVKVVLEELDPLALNALRFPLAAGALAIGLRFVPGPLLPRRQDVGRVLLLGVVGNVAYQLCFIFGLDWTLAGNASLLLSTTPVWTLVFSAVSGHERPTSSAVLGVLATLVGIAFVVLGRGDALSLASGTLAGDLLILAGSMLWALYTVAGRVPVDRYGPLRLTTWALCVGTPVLVAMGLPSLVTTDLGGISPGAWGGVVYAGLLSVGLAYLLWYRGVRKLGNSRTAIYSNLVPVMALFTAWLWLGEMPTALQLVGAAIILSGLTLARLGQSPRLPEPPSSGSPPRSGVPPTSGGPISLDAPDSDDARRARWRISGNS